MYISLYQTVNYSAIFKALTGPPQSKELTKSTTIQHNRFNAVFAPIDDFQSSFL